MDVDNSADVLSRRETQGRICNMPSTHLWKPELLDLSVESDRIRLNTLREGGSVLEEYDTLDAQVAEWAVCHRPAAKSDPSLLASTLSTLMEGEDWETFGTWVHYPWSGRLVHVLPEHAFIEVRTNRNRDKITKEETARLQSKTVGIVGLSVGQATAISLAMERGCGTLKLADFDVIELSNLNRIRCSVHELELPKWVVAARTIFEFDPYFNIEIYEDGVDAANVRDFLAGCDVVVDACDSLAVKAQLRLEAMTQGCPLVMDTNDRGMLDVERYDLLNAEDGYLHGRIDQHAIEAFAQMEQWTPEALNAFVDVENASERGRMSLPKVGSELVSWPQTYTGVAAGGAHAAETCRRLALGESLPDARITMDLHEQFSYAPVR